MVMSDEQVNKIHEMFGERLRDHETRREDLQSMDRAAKVRRDRGFDIINQIMHWIRYESIAYLDEDPPLCPHCKKDLTEAP